MRKIYILDTTALISWRLPTGEAIVTCPHVVSEARGELTGAIVEAYLHTGNLNIQEPEDNYIKEAVEAAKKMGDLVKLSETDIHVIALAIKYMGKGYRPIVVTDDYSIQNILDYMGIDYMSYYRRIRTSIKWIMICKQCGKTYPPETTLERCEECGGEIVRRRARFS